MLTKELTNRLEELGYGWDMYDYVNNTYIDIYNPHNHDDPDEVLATVCTNKPYTFNTNTYQFNNLNEEYKKELHELLTEYSSTPADEREDPNQKYTYKHKYLKSKHGDDTYLAISLKSLGKLYSHLEREVTLNKNYQCLFTNAEIEKYSKELDIDLDNYIKEEAPTTESNDYTEGRQVNL